MKKLVAKECLSEDIKFVFEEERPDLNVENFAVFKDKGKEKFLGLVKQSEIINPSRIFADLLSSGTTHFVLPDTPLLQCEEKMRMLNADVLPVIDKNNKFYGIIDYANVCNYLISKNYLHQNNVVKLFDALKNVLHGIEKYHDSFTLSHEENTGKLMKCLGKALGYNEAFCNSLEEAGSLHDIGKLGLPADIIEKPGSLNSYEKEVILMHPEIGAKILEKVDHPLAQVAAHINLYHHEAYDGSGYPKGYQKEKIPIEARICSICDIYEALRATRPYHNGKTHEEVVDIILGKNENGLNKKFDPQILEVFSEIHEEFDIIVSSTRPKNLPKID